MRDGFGRCSDGRTDELTAPDDKTIVFRLKKPFPLLPDALGKSPPNGAIMPERLANTDPFKQVTEMVGSGPFRFKTDERVAGSLVVYERFKAYSAAREGIATFTAGPKVAHFDRIEWQFIPDPRRPPPHCRPARSTGGDIPTPTCCPSCGRTVSLTVDHVPTGFRCHVLVQII